MILRMKLYLVRHGEAKSDREDPARPLSDRGRKDVERVARAVGRLGIEVGAIHHSGKLRARQTAEILAGALAPAQGVKEMAGLSPEDDPSVTRHEIENAKAAMMLVGHLPHLSLLASELLVGDRSKELIAFPTACVIALERQREDWRLLWTIAPQLLGD